MVSCSSLSFHLYFRGGGEREVPFFLFTLVLLSIFLVLFSEIFPCFVLSILFCPCLLYTFFTGRISNSYKFLLDEWSRCQTQ
jgi:hypothetical protein